MKCQYCGLSYDGKDFCQGCGAPKGKDKPASQSQPEPEVVPSIQFRGASRGAQWVIALVTIGGVILIALLGMGVGQKKPIPAPQTGIYDEVANELVWTGIATEVEWSKQMSSHPYAFQFAIIIRNSTGVTYHRIGFFWLAAGSVYPPNQTIYLVRKRSNQYYYLIAWNRTTNATVVPVTVISEKDVLLQVFPARLSSDAGPAVPAGFHWSGGPWVKDYEGRILDYVGDALGHVFTLEGGDKLRLAGDLFYNKVPINETVRIWRCTGASPNKIFVEAVG